MSEVRTKGVDTEGVLLTAMEGLQDMQAEQGAVLIRLEQRPIVELSGLERRLEDVADAVERLKAPEVRRRPWWLTPALVTLAAVASALATYALLLWLAQRVPVAVNKTQTPVVSTPAKKGK